MKFWKSTFGILGFLAAAGFVACSNENENGVPANDENGVPAEAQKSKENSAFPWVWLDRIEPALEKARAEKKLVLVEFTGSDWCPPCKILREKVLASPEFIAFAKDKFVFVELDFPRTPAVAGTQSDETKKYNAEAAKKFFLNAFPTILVLDAGTAWPIAKIIGIDAGTDEYLAKFEKSVAAGQAFAANLKNARDEEILELRAEKLYAVLQARAPELKVHFPELESEIIAADPADKLGVAKMVDERIARANQQIELSMLAGPFVQKCGAAKSESEIREINAEAMKVSAQILAREDLYPEVRQWYLANFYAHQAAIAMQAPTDFDLLKKIYAEIIELVPASPEAQEARENLELIERILSKEE